MIAILRWELARRKMYILWWSLGIIALVAMLMAIYPSIHAQAAQLDTVLKQMPESVRALRGGDTDLTSPVGYLNAELFYITLPLLLIIMAVNLGGALLARDEQDHTLELLLARPVSRGRVLIGKALAGVLIMALVGLLATVATIVLAKIVNLDLPVHYIALAGLWTTIFSMSFGVVTFSLNAASVFSRRLGIAIAVIASFGGYILQSLSSVSDYIKRPAELLPYHYFVPKDILHGTVAHSLMVYMLAIFIGGAILSYVGFRRRDIG
jgi:ABC-2 type transport system permease protein